MSQGHPETGVIWSRESKQDSRTNEPSAVSRCTHWKGPAVVYAVSLIAGPSETTWRILSGKNDFREQITLDSQRGLAWIGHLLYAGQEDFRVWQISQTSESDTYVFWKVIEGNGNVQPEKEMI